MPHPQIKIVGETADGTIKAIAVAPDGSLVTSGGSGGGGSGDASAANQLEEITQLSLLNTDIGDPDDPIADPSLITGDAYTAPTNYTVFSLLKGLFITIDKLLYKVFFIREAPLVQVLDFSGITDINQGQRFFVIPTNPSYLIIQNLVHPNFPSNNLWINFGYDAYVGSGCIQIKPGETLEMKGTCLLQEGNSIFLIGEEAGQQYTFKLAGN